MTSTGYKLLFKIGVGDQITPKYFMFDVWVPRASYREEAIAMLVNAEMLTSQNTYLPNPTTLFRGYGKENIPCESAQKAITLAEEMNAICPEKIFEAHLNHIRFIDNKQAPFNLAVYAMSFIAYSMPEITWAPMDSYCLYFNLGPGLLDI